MHPDSGRYRAVILLESPCRSVWVDDPATAQRQRLETALTKSSEAIKRLIGAYQEQLLTLEELRSRMPELRTREASLHHQLEGLDAALADREVYLQLADNLQDFLTGLRDKAATASVAERQRVLRLLVKDVLVGPDKITIRHCIPTRSGTGHRTQEETQNDSEGEIRRDCQLRWRSHGAAGGRHLGTGRDPHPGRDRSTADAALAGSDSAPASRAATYRATV